ncbi:hypothetical protein HK102_003417, partial [Quaeritorhiza haematococci]
MNKAFSFLYESRQYGEQALSKRFRDWEEGDEEAEEVVDHLETVVQSVPRFESVRARMEAEARLDKLLFDMETSGESDDEDDYEDDDDEEWDDLYETDEDEYWDEDEKRSDHDDACDADDDDGVPQDLMQLGDADLYEADEKQNVNDDEDDENDKDLHLEDADLYGATHSREAIRRASRRGDWFAGIERNRGIGG